MTRSKQPKAKQPTGKARAQARKAEENGKAEEPPTIPDAIVIRRDYTENGLELDVQVTGGVMVTEVPTILELAIKQTRQRIGLSSDD